jgi:hypothetical protein
MAASSCKFPYGDMTKMPAQGILTILDDGLPWSF